MAKPESYSDLPDLFTSGAGTIAETLERPPELRYGGFSLSYQSKSKIIDGEFRRVTTGSYKVLDLYPDGVLVFAGAADQEFLSWAINDFEDYPKFNNVALAEVTYHFCLLYTEVLTRLTPTPSRNTISVELGNLRPDKKAPMRLLNAEHDSARWLFDDQAIEAPNDMIRGKVTISTDDFKPETAAYAILERIYRGFGIGSDQYIPYTRESNRGKAVDVRKIQSLR